MSTASFDSGAPQSYRIGDAVLEIVRGDITHQDVDAIVNAANRQLTGGGGVDGAIHRAGGPSILQECQRIGGCPTGQAVVTGAGALPCRWIIHAVGPIWQGGQKGEPALLQNCYRETMKRATELGAASLALAAISTGVYGYPLTLAAPIALSTTVAALETSTVTLLRFVLFNDEAFSHYRAAAKRL